MWISIIGQGVDNHADIGRHCEFSYLSTKESDDANHEEPSVLLHVMRQFHDGCAFRFFGFLLFLRSGSYFVAVIGGRSLSCIVKEVFSGVVLLVVHATFI